MTRALELAESDSRGRNSRKLCRQWRITIAIQQRNGNHWRDRDCWLCDESIQAKHHWRPWMTAHTVAVLYINALCFHNGHDIMSHRTWHQSVHHHHAFGQALDLSESDSRGQNSRKLCRQWWIAWIHISGCSDDWLIDLWHGLSPLITRKLCYDAIANMTTRCALYKQDW